MAVEIGTQGRLVRDVVDGGGLYFSRLASAGPYAFLSGVAADETGGVVSEAHVAPPYSLSPPAHVVAQTQFVFGRYKALLEELGSGINEIVQVEQHIPHKIYADGYIDVSRAKGFMDKGRPTSALLCTGDLMPTGCVINPTGIAVLPGTNVKKEIPPSSEGYQESLTSDEYGESYIEEGPFNEVVTAGGYVFTVGDVVMNWQTRDIEEEVRIGDHIWWGSEIRNEADFLATRLEWYLSRVEATLADVVHTTVYLLDIGDLFELDRVWKRRFPKDPPARTVVPVRGLGAPRLEAPGLGHKDLGVKMEHLTQSIRSGFGVTKEVVSTGAAPLQHESEAIKAGPLLWISGQFAVSESGLPVAADTAGQLEHLFGRLEAICRAGGTRLNNLVRLRAFLTNPGDAYLVYAALKRAVPSDPPSVMVTGVPGPLQIPGCTVQLDAVAYIE
jgi:enamine deaminase RidA (YjgF/YER057c/UK114 family)